METKESLINCAHCKVSPQTRKSKTGNFTIYCPGSCKSSVSGRPKSKVIEAWNKVHVGERMTQYYRTVLQQIAKPRGDA